VLIMPILRTRSGIRNLIFNQTNNNLTNEVRCDNLHLKLLYHFFPDERTGYHLLKNQTMPLTLQADRLSRLHLNSNIMLQHRLAG